MTHSELKKRALEKEGVKAKYDALEPEFALLRELLQARRKAGLSQADIAKKNGHESAGDYKTGILAYDWKAFPFNRNPEKVR